jgi:hypothetical protein
MSMRSARPIGCLEWAEPLRRNREKGYGRYIEERCIAGLRAFKRRTVCQTWGNPVAKGHSVVAQSSQSSARDFATERNRSEWMRVNRIIRPQLYADAIDGAVSAASAKIGILDVSFEAKRIAKVTGFSPIIAARDLIEASVAARINMEFTRVT